MTGSKARSTLVATALGLLLGSVALPALAEAPIGLRDNRQANYSATATVGAGLNAYLSNAERSATAGAFDAVTRGRYATISPAATGLRSLTLASDVPAAAYDTGRVSGAFSAPVVGDAIQAALRDRVTGEGRFTVNASLTLAPISRGLLADRTSDAFGRLGFGRALDVESLASKFAAQTSGDGALREAMRADAGESGLFANQRGSFSSPVSSDVLAGAFAEGAEGSFSAPVADTGLRAAMRSEGSGSGFSGDGTALSVAVDLDELAAGLASDSLDQGDFAVEASLSSATADPVLDAMRADRSGGGFLAADAVLGSSPQAVDFERIGAILVGADGE
jgi:hypothetical protein